jgi:hypothetical protein
MVDDADHFDESSAQDRLLDALVSHCEEVMSSRFIRPSDEELAAYLSDNATETQVSSVQKALAASPAFRREVLETIDELSQLSRPGIRRSFEALDSLAPAAFATRALGRAGLAPARVHSRRWWRSAPSWGNPKLAYSVAAAAVLVAALSVLQSGDDISTSGSTLKSQSIHLLAQSDLNFRATGEDLNTPALDLTTETEILAAHIWLPESMRPTGEDNYLVTLSDERGTISSRPLPAEVNLVDDQPTLTVALRAGQLHPGLLTLRIERRNADGGAMTVWCRLRLRFE